MPTVGHDDCIGSCLEVLREDNRATIASRHGAPDETLLAGGSAGAGTVCRACPRSLKTDALPPERYNLSPRLRRGLFFCGRYGNG